jgi:putative hydrolase of the HAD superfamily
MAIRGIFFDAADVFYQREERTIDRVKRLLRESGHDDHLSSADQARQRALDSEAYGGRLTPEDYWDAVLTMHGVDNPQERRTLIERILVHVNNVHAIPGGHEAVSALKKRGFILGVITDTIYPMEWKMSWLDRVGVGEYIDVVACSTNLGAHKPDPAIYLDAVRQAGMAPAETCFVGHDARELEGAHQVGMATVAVRYDRGAQADYYAENLPDLLAVPILQNHDPKAGMMSNDIQAIFLDVGNTLRIVIEDAQFQADARRNLMALVGAHGSEETFFGQLETRWKAYRKWSFENLTEASENELWTRFMLPDFPSGMIGPLSGKLTRLWRDKDGRRVPRPDVKAVVVELDRRGYVLGIIANTITETEIPDWLEADGLGRYFGAVVLSSKVRYRKPGPEIYWEAAKRAGVAPEHCAYVGDNPLRDVEGTRRAGFGMTIILLDDERPVKMPPAGENEPDRIIHQCSDLLAIFPPRRAATSGSQ